MEPHGQGRSTIISPRCGEHPVPEHQFTHGQGRGSLGTGIAHTDKWFKDRLAFFYLYFFPVPAWSYTLKNLLNPPLRAGINARLLVMDSRILL